MTNAEIIFRASLELAEEGVIRSKVLKVECDDGTIKEILQPEPIHTFQHWKELGFSVKKGEHCKARIMIWKMGKGKAEQEVEIGKEPEGRMFMKQAFFFTFDQVEPLKK